MSVKVFFEIRPERVHVPVWHFNFDASQQCTWRLCPSRPLPPCAIPLAVRELAQGHILFQQVSEREHLLPAAVKSGRVFLAWQYRKMIASWGLKLPRKGTGKNERVKIIDLCRVLADHFLEGLSEEERQAHAAKMAGKTKDTQDDGMEPQLLEAVSKLDEKEQGNFRDIVDRCLNQLEKQHKEGLPNKRPKPDPEVEGSKEMPAAAGKPSSSTPPPTPAEVFASAADDTMNPGGPASSSKGPSEHTTLPPAREKKAPVLRGYAIKKAAAVKRPAPPEIASLFPKVPGLYIKWLPNDRRITIEFTSLQGSGFQRTKTASWPAFCGVGPKESAVHTVLEFVQLALKVHFKDWRNADGSNWVIPSRAVIQDRVTELLTRELHEKGQK